MIKDELEISILKEPLPDEAGWRKTAVSNVTTSDLFARTPFSANVLDILQKSRVAIFGQGSGGGKISVDLAKSGVGKYRNFDPSRLQEHNVNRHVASLLDVDRWKVDAVADIMLLNNPSVEVEAYPYNLFDPESILKPHQILLDVDLIVAATDRTEAQLAINYWACELEIPAIFGGCYEGARGGEVLFTLPGEYTPCLSCLRGGLKGPEHRGPFDYSDANVQEDFQGEPGLSAAIDLITDVETQIALALLLRGTDSPLGDLIQPQLNFILIGGALGAGFYRFRRPFQIYFQPLSGPRPNCDVCG